LLVLSAGFLFMHLRLRNKASRVVITSFITIVVWVNFSQLVFEKIVELTSTAKPADQTVAEALMDIATTNDYGLILFYVQFALSIIFCTSFFLSAYSIPRLTTQSRRPP
jgi:hypothetical protein